MFPQSDFNNGRSTVPVLSDTGAVLSISTGAVLVPVLDDNALSALAEYFLPVPGSTGFIRASHYWQNSTGIVLITINRDCINNK